MQTLRHMAAEGFCIIFISHKLDEVLAVADRITVLRRGRVVATTDAATSDRRGLARLMVGREVDFKVNRPARHARRSRAHVPGLRAQGDRGLPALAGRGPAGLRGRDPGRRRAWPATASAS